MTERILVRGGKPCGIYFCLHGPRSVQVTAIWETDRNTVLFYNCSGERFHKALLVQSPCLSSTPNFVDELEEEGCSCAARAA